MESCQMNEKYALNTPFVSKNYANSLQSQLSKTLVNSVFKSALIQLNDATVDSALPAEIRLGLQEDCSQKYITFPILYQKKKIGDLRVSDTTDSDPKGESAPELARKIALLIKRFQATELKQYYLGKELCLAGYSNALIELEAFIEKAASAKCPVIIGGEQGCEKLAVASAIHSNSSISDQPFIEISCVTSSAITFQRQLLRGLKRAQGGCIFLNGVDELSLEQQNVLTEFLSSRVMLKGVVDSQAKASNVRLLVSTTQPLPEMILQGQFSKKLFSELNFLNVWITPIAQRKEDIPSIMGKLLNKYRLHHAQTFSPAAINAFQQYHWPENYEELERVVVRLVCLSNRSVIGLAEIEQLVPEIMQRQALVADVPNHHMSESELKENPDQLVDILLNQRFDAIEGLHPGLQKALKYMSLNYCHEVTLSVLSSNAFISPSHLSFLFKSSLATSFKPLLARLRIERAKAILQAKPNSRITDVSLEVGFGDLSHFEKIFKRLTGMTPRDYKNACKNK